MITPITDNVLFGNIGDTRPLTGIVENTLYFELDSGDVYKFVGGVWSVFASRLKTETLENKTIVQPVIAKIKDANGNLLTLPLGPDTLIGRNTTDTLANKTLTNPNIAAVTVGGGLVTFPSGPQTLVGRTTNDTLTNKNINVNSNPISATGIQTGDLLVSNGVQFLRFPRGSNLQQLRANTSTLEWFTPPNYAATDITNTWSAVQTFNDTKLVLRNPANTFNVTLGAGAQTASKSFTFPLISGASDTINTATSTVTQSNKTIPIDTNTITHSTTNALGDLLKNDGTKYSRFARGTANQVLAVNSGGTDLAWTTLGSERTGTATGSGNGISLPFTIPHGLGSTPFVAFVQCYSHNTAFTFTWDATNITVTFATAPPSGTNNVLFVWRVVA